MQSLSPGDPQLQGELGGGGRHLCSLVTRMEGPRSSTTVANFMTRCAARRPICVVLARPWQMKGAQGREKSWQGGARGRGGEGQSCP